MSLVLPITSILRRDLEDGGSLSITELVTELDAAVSRRVLLYDQPSGRVVREQWSDKTTGEVTFSFIRRGPWLLCSIDHTVDFEAVALSDRLATEDGSRP